MADRIKKVSISNAWGETIRFVAREAGLLAPVAIFLLALPSVLLGILTPDMTTDAEPGTAFWVLFLPLIIVSGVGSLAITVLALTSGISVGEALKRAARRFVPLLVVLIGLALMAIILMVPITLFAAGTEADPMRAASRILVVLAILLPLIFYVSARLSMIFPVAAAEEGGVFAILKRSLKLTKGVGWKLAIAYFILSLTFALLLRVIVMVTAILIALVGAAPEQGGLGLFALQLVAGLVTAAFSLYLQVFLARIYVQLEANQTSGS